MTVRTVLSTYLRTGEDVCLHTSQLVRKGLLRPCGVLFTCYNQSRPREMPAWLRAEWRPKRLRCRGGQRLDELDLRLVELTMLECDPAVLFRVFVAIRFRNLSGPARPSV